MEKISITWSAALLLGVLLLPLLFLPQASAASQGSSLPRLTPPTPNTVTKKWNDFLKTQLTYLSTPLMLKVAQKLGITQVKGRSLTLTKTVAAQQVRTGPNIPVADSPYEAEWDPSIAVNPVNDKMVLAFLMDESTYGCSVWYSDNAGLTWVSSGNPPTSPNDPTTPAYSDYCMDPVVRWSPDGLGAYLSYLSVRADLSTSDVIVTVDYNPPYGWWTAGSLIVLAAGVANTFFWDRPWIGVHQSEAGWPSGLDAPYVYVSATYLSLTLYHSNLPGDLICFDASNLYGTPGSFIYTGSPLILNTPSISYVQFSRPMGGYGPSVLVCWYNSEPDGPQYGAFSIRCRSSPNNGATWSVSEILAVARSLYELPYFLSGNGGLGYHYWWTSMGPFIAMSPDGRAHIVFTRDPTVSQTDSECGDVMYTRTPTANNYALWSIPVPIGTFGLFAQGFPTITVQLRPPGLQPTPLGYRLYVSYYDHRLSPIGANANILYDVFMRYSNTGGTIWSAPTRITEQSSMSGFNPPGVGDYIDSSAGSRKVWFIWTDRADKLSVYDYETDVFTEFVSAD